MSAPPSLVSTFHAALLLIRETNSQQRKRSSGLSLCAAVSTLPTTEKQPSSRKPVVVSIMALRLFSSGMTCMLLTRDHYMVLTPPQPKHTGPRGGSGTGTFQHYVNNLITHFSYSCPGRLGLCWFEGLGPRKWSSPGRDNPGSI